MPKITTLELEIKQTITNSRSQAIEKLAANLNSLKTAVSGIEKDLGAAANGLGRFAEAMDKGSTVAANIKKAGTALKKLIEDSKGADSAANGIGRIAESLERLGTASGKVTGVGAALRKVKQASPGTGDSDTGKVRGGVTARDINYTPKNIASVEGNVTKAEAKVRQFRFSLKEAYKSGNQLINAGWDKLKNKLSGMTSGLGNLLNSFKRIAMYRFLRSAIREITQGFSEGISHLYEWSRVMDSTFKNSMDSIATSAHYLRDSLGAMASPLIDALAPAIEFVVDKFVALLNIVNQFIATFTGATSWRRAVRTPTEYSAGLEDAANSAKKATEAQKKLNKALMDFDEIHLITTSTSGGSNPSSPSGGGGGGDDYSTHFVEEPIADWIQAIKDAIENGDWYGAGAMLADKLNSIIDNWDAEAWGRKLGEKIQHGIEFYLGFMDTFHWEGLGGKIADFLNGLIDEVNPNDLGRAIVAKFNAAIGFLNGFTKRFDWTAAGKWLADVLVGAFTGLNWGTLGQLVKNLAGGILDMIKAGLDRLSKRKGEIFSAIGDFFSNLGWDGLKNVVELAAIVLGFKTLFSAVFGNAGLISAVKGYVGGMLGDLGLNGGLALTIGVSLVWAASEIVDNVKKYGADKGLWMSFGILDPKLQLEIEAELGTSTSFSESLSVLNGFEFLQNVKKGADYFKDSFSSNPDNLPFFQRITEIINKFLKLLGFDPIDFSGGKTGSNSGGSLPTSSTPTISQNNYGAMYDPTTGSWFIPASASGSVPPLPSVPSGSLPDTAYGSQFLGDMADKSKALKDNLNAINKTPWKATLTDNGNGIKNANDRTAAIQKKLNEIKNGTYKPKVVFSDNYDTIEKHRKAIAKGLTTSVKYKVTAVTSSTNSSGKTIETRLSKTQLQKVLGFAEGGWPDTGSLFVAGESGPELVGQVNGKTGVASGKEVTGISDAVYNTGETEAALLREQNSLLRQLLAKKSEVTLAPNVAAGKWVNQAQAAYARATG